ncbi:MAG: hypothetical protein ACTSUE_15130 [Promethearchaeota archaeon]
MVSIKGLDTDTLFKAWLEKADLKTLEKFFKKKKVDFKRENVSVGETVKSYPKFIVVYYEKDVSKAMSDLGPARDGTSTPPKLGNVKFFDFKGRKVSLESWKYEKEVPVYATLKEVKCAKCGGTGKISCSKCSGEGVVKCNNCGGKATIVCNSCKGKKSKEVDIEIIDADGKKSKVTKKIPCPDCHSVGSYKCSVCGGLTKHVCKSCGGRGYTSCSDCKGYGISYRYEIQPVPIEKTGKQAMVYFKKDVEKFITRSSVEKLLVKRDVKGIVITNPDDLKDKKLKPELGYWTKDSDKVCKDAKNDYKKLEKSKIIKKGTKIIILPAIQLDCQSVKGKKFQIFGIGTQDSFIVIDHDFK